MSAVPEYQICNKPRNRWHEGGVEWIVRGRDGVGRIRVIWTAERAGASRFMVYETAQSMADLEGGVVMQAEVQRELALEFRGPRQEEFFPEHAHGVSV